MYPEHPEAPERMAALVPDARLIYLIRHPVDRVRSQYAHNLDRALEARAIGEAIRHDPSYLNATRYDLQISRFEQHFQPEQMMVIVSERLRHDRNTVLTAVLDHIGVDPTVELSNTDRELNTMVDKRLAPPIVNRARRTARALGVNRLLSRSSKARLRLAVSRTMPEEAVELSHEDRSWILSELHDDLDRLRARVGSQLDMWRLGSERAT